MVTCITMSVFSELFNQWVNLPRVPGRVFNRYRSGTVRQRASLGGWMYMKRPLFFTLRRIAECYQSTEKNKTRRWLKPHRIITNTNKDTVSVIGVYFHAPLADRRLVSVRRRRRSHRTSDKELRASFNGDAHGLVNINLHCCTVSESARGEREQQPSVCLQQRSEMSGWCDLRSPDIVAELWAGNAAAKHRPANEWMNDRTRLARRDALFWMVKGVLWCVCYCNNPHTWTVELASRSWKCHDAWTEMHFDTVSCRISGITVTDRCIPHRSVCQ